MLEDPTRLADESLPVEVVELINSHWRGSPTYFSAQSKTHPRTTPSTSADTAPDSARAFCTAQNIRSGVNGLSSVTTPPFPKAEMASRIASRTEMASITDGSPTALLPKITPGSAARSRNATSNDSGSSGHDGSL